MVEFRAIGGPTCLPEMYERLSNRRRQFKKELPKSPSSAVRRRKQVRNIILLKDPMKRLWPVFYHENLIFVGFTTGWKPFAAANNLQMGDLCKLFEEPGDEEPVYSVQITKK